MRSDGSLYIERASPEDAGTYVCTAVNVAGTMNITVSLEVQGKSSCCGGLIHFCNESWDRQHLAGEPKA